MSIRQLSNKEELARRRKKFKQIRQGLLFDCRGAEYFLAVDKVGEKEWNVIALTDENREAIISSWSPGSNRAYPPQLTKLHFDQMSGLNLHEWRELP